MNLILIPTELELNHLQPLLPLPDRCVERCGFGPIAAAARTAKLLEARKPDRVLLLGIAGSLQERCEVGQAYVCDRVWCDGVGVGFGDDFCGVDSLGWKHFDRIGEEIRLETRRVSEERAQAAAEEEGEVRSGPFAGLLTVCAASADARHASSRRKRFAQAGLEDMEGFAVALACQLAKVPLTIVRGVSNIAGNRDHALWQISSALESVAAIANEWPFSEPSSGQSSASIPTGPKGPTS